MQEAGPDYAATIEKVQQGLTLPVMQELNARVDIDKQDPQPWRRSTSRRSATSSR